MTDEGFCQFINTVPYAVHGEKSFPFFNVGSLPWDTVLDEVLQCGSIPRATVIHKQRVSLSQCAVLQGQAAPLWVLLRVTIPTKKPAGDLLSPHLFRSLPGACSSTCLPQGHSLLSSIHLLEHGLQVISASPGCPWASGTQLPHHGLHHWLQGNLISGTWSTSLPSFSTDLGACRIILNLLFSVSSYNLQ